MKLEFIVAYYGPESIKSANSQTKHGRAYRNQVTKMRETSDKACVHCIQHDAVDQGLRAEKEKLSPTEHKHALHCMSHRRTPVRLLCKK